MTTSEASTELPARPRLFTAPWLLSQQQDLLFLIGSVAVPFVLLGLWFARIVTATQVMLLWVFVFHGPHFWATWSRTIVDRQWWKTRSHDFWMSARWFLAGPIIVGISLLIQAGTGWNGIEQTFLFGAAVWAYHHVVKQHFGFMALYRAKAGEFDRAELMIHKRWLVASLWLPVLIALTNHVHWISLVPFLMWFGQNVVGTESYLWAASGFATAATWTFVGLQLLAIGSLARRWVIGRTINVGETLVAAAAVSIHWVAVTAILSPNAPTEGLAPYIFVPLVTMFHNVQYQALVWHYNKTKYVDEPSNESGGLARTVNRNIGVFLGAGLLYTLATIGLEYWPSFVGLDWKAASPAWLTSFLVACIWGFSFIHYDFDAKIWKVSVDPELRRVLGFSR